MLKQGTSIHVPGVYTWMPSWDGKWLSCLTSCFKYHDFLLFPQLTAHSGIRLRVLDFITMHIFIVMSVHVAHVLLCQKNKTNQMAWYAKLTNMTNVCRTGMPGKITDYKKSSLAFIFQTLLPKIGQYNSHVMYVHWIHSGSARYFWIKTFPRHEEGKFLRHKGAWNSVVCQSTTGQFKEQSESTLHFVDGPTDKPCVRATDMSDYKVPVILHGW